MAGNPALLKQLGKRARLIGSLSYFKTCYKITVKAVDRTDTGKWRETNPHFTSDL